MFVITSGKGGVGKTTLAAALMRWLQLREAQSMDRVLCVDADPVGILGQLLGADTVSTVTDRYDGHLRPEHLTLKHAQDVVHTLPDGGDFVEMGRHTHEGCACKINALMKATLTHLASQYAVVMMDNEAGLEHTTRGTSAAERYKQQGVLLLVVDSSRASVRVASDILHTVKGLNRITGAAKTVGVRVPDAVQDKVRAMCAEYGLPAPMFLPYDENIAAAQTMGEPLPTSLDTPYMTALDQWLSTSNTFEPVLAALE